MTDDKSKEVSLDTPPDRLSIDPRSPHFNAEVLQRDVGIRFKGVEKTNVEEYSVSEGWCASPPAPPRIATAIN